MHKFCACLTKPLVQLSPSLLLFAIVCLMCLISVLVFVGAHHNIRATYLSLQMFPRLGSYTVPPRQHKSLSVALLCQPQNLRGPLQTNKHKFVHISCEGAHPLSIYCTFYIARISGPYEILAPAGCFGCSLRLHD